VGLAQKQIWKIEFKTVELVFAPKCSFLVSKF
jgi:hypothetical protein